MLRLGFEPADGAFDIGSAQAVQLVPRLARHPLGERRSRRNRSTHHVFVGKRSGRARHHAFAARDACRIAHRYVQIERDVRGISFPHAAQHKIAFDFVAAADAAVAENARIVVHGNRQRRIVSSSRNAVRMKRLRSRRVGAPRAGFAHTPAKSFQQLFIPTGYIGVRTSCLHESCDHSARKDHSRDIAEFTPPQLSFARSRMIWPLRTSPGIATSCNAISLRIPRVSLAR